MRQKASKCPDCERHVIKRCIKHQVRDAISKDELWEMLDGERKQYADLVKETAELLQRLERCGLNGSADRAREQARVVKALLPKDGE